MDETRRAVAREALNSFADSMNRQSDAVVAVVPNDGSCDSRQPGHKHCKHGHTTDCPDPDNCAVY